MPSLYTTTLPSPKRTYNGRLFLVSVMALFQKTPQLSRETGASSPREVTALSRAPMRNRRPWLRRTASSPIGDGVLGSRVGSSRARSSSRFGRARDFSAPNPSPPSYIPASSLFPKSIFISHCPQSPIWCAEMSMPPAARKKKGSSPSALAAAAAAAAALAHTLGRGAVAAWR